MLEVGERLNFATPEMAVLYARLQKERLATALQPDSEAADDKLRKLAFGLPFQAREDSVIDPEALHNLQDKLNELRNLVTTRRQKPYLTAPELDIPRHRAVWEGEKDLIKFYMEADPGTNVDDNDIRRLDLTEDTRGQRNTNVTFFFDGTFECEITFRDAAKTLYNSGTQKLDAMTQEEYGIIKSVLEEGQKAIAPKPN